MREEELLHFFPGTVRCRFEKMSRFAEEIQEIRLQVHCPVRIIKSGEEVFLGQTGEILLTATEDSWKVTPEELELIFNHICNYSRYAYEEDIRQGYLTLPGGHRVGLAGQVAVNQEGKIQAMKYIRFLNIRISHEVIGAADRLLPELHRDGQLLNTLIISPPGCGKTTLLRDLVRQISDGSGEFQGREVGVVDERSEIAGCYRGIPENRIGMRTDVLDGCPKSIGMMLLLRTMAPKVIAVDEIGSREDAAAISEIQKSGCVVMATMHGSSPEDVLRSGMEEALFDCFVFMKKEDGRCMIDRVIKRRENV